jgi:hypothetical protein
VTDVAFAVVFVVVAGFGFQALWAHHRIGVLIGALESTADRVEELAAASDLRGQLGEENRCQHLAFDGGGVVPCEATAIVLAESSNGSVHAYCSAHRPSAAVDDWSHAA